MVFRVLHGSGIRLREERLELLDMAARRAIELMQEARASVRVILPDGSAIRMGAPPQRRRAALSR